MVDKRENIFIGWQITIVRLANDWQGGLGETPSLQVAFESSILDRLKGGLLLEELLKHYHFLSEKPITDLVF